MEEATRYIAFDGAVFSYKEDAEFHEIMRRLRAKHTVLGGQVSDLMRLKHEVNGKVTKYENDLKTINDTFKLHPEIMNDTENVRLMARRIHLRFMLKTTREQLKSIKKVLVEQNRKFSKTEMDIRRYTTEHDALVKSQDRKNDGIKEPPIV